MSQEMNTSLAISKEEYVFGEFKSANRPEELICTNPSDRGAYVFIPEPKTPGRVDEMEEQWRWGIGPGYIVSITERLSNRRLGVIEISGHLLRTELLHQLKQAEWTWDRQRRFVEVGGIKTSSGWFRVSRGFAKRGPHGDNQDCLFFRPYADPENPYAGILATQAVQEYLFCFDAEQVARAKQAEIHLREYRSRRSK